MYHTLIALGYLIIKITPTVLQKRKNINFKNNHTHIIIISPPEENSKNTLHEKNSLKYFTEYRRRFR